MRLNKKKRIALLIVFVILLAILIALLLFMGRSSSEKEKIGFVMTGSIGEEGWNGMHYGGISAACDNLDVELLVKENIKEFEGECGTAIEDLVNQGCRMIILSSYSYAEEVKEVIEKYPEISFYSISFDYHADNVTSYFPRIYQARYLAGIVAGMQTETNRIGYVAAMPNSEVNRGISAFALGVRRVNPDAVVTVSWSNASKPIEGAGLEKMLLKYIPQDKISVLQQKSENESEHIQIEAQKAQSCINRELGLRYCDSDMEFYKEMLELYCNSYEDRVDKMAEALKAEDWKNYTVFAHGLKSTSLSIGGEQVSKAAKELELAGKSIGETDNADEGKAFIKEHHDATMNLYSATAREAKNILKELG